MSKYAIAIHGGAGTILRANMLPETEREYREALEAAVIEAENILMKNGTAMDAVEAAVRSLEDCPLFNAGRGSVFNHDGKHEMDAAIMDGRTLGAGAVSGVRGIKNPVALARAVMQNTEHVYLTGDGAITFARNIGMHLEPDDYFFVQYRYDQFQEALKDDKVTLDHTEMDTPDHTHKMDEDRKFGTVGAVAIDRNGNIAAATSTGGMTNKKFGRVGDSPIIGAGTYANNRTCAISCTGHGEYFIRAVVAHDISCLMEYKGLTLQEACDLVVQEKLMKMGGEGGLIALDAQGNVTMSFNSEGMYRAMKREGEQGFVGIYR